MQPQQAPSYAASPLGAFPELSQMYATNFSSPLSDAKMGAQANQDQVSVENAKKAAAEAEANAKAFSDPSKYTIQQRSDGGFGFYGPDGKEVSAAQYANNTGQKLTDVLKDSQNPIDIRYVNDANNLSKYYQARAQYKVDPNQKKIADKIEQEVKASFGIDLHKQNPLQIKQDFQNAYPTIYGNNQNNAAGYVGDYPGQQTQNHYIGANQFLPSPQNLYNQAGGEAKFNKGRTSTNRKSGSGNPT